LNDRIKSRSECDSQDEAKTPVVELGSEFNLQVVVFAEQAKA